MNWNWLFFFYFPPALYLLIRILCVGCVSIQQPQQQRTRTQTTQTTQTHTHTHWQNKLAFYFAHYLDYVLPGCYWNPSAWWSRSIYWHVCRSPKSRSYRRNVSDPLLIVVFCMLSLFRVFFSSFFPQIYLISIWLLLFFFDQRNFLHTLFIHEFGEFSV